MILLVDSASWKLLSLYNAVIVINAADQALQQSMTSGRNKILDTGMTIQIRHLEADKAKFWQHCQKCLLYQQHTNTDMPMFLLELDSNAHLQLMCTRAATTMLQLAKRICQRCTRANA